MLEAKAFVEATRQHGFDLWSGVPCSYLQPFINFVIADPGSRYVPACNEGEAVSIAAGVEVGGGRAVAMFQNSGLGNAVNPLTSLTNTHLIPVLLIATLRGEPGGAPDEPQHALMGSITTRLLDLLEVRWEYFPDRNEEIGPCLRRALSWMDAERTPYCLVMRRGSVTSVPAPPPFPVRPAGASRPAASATTRPVARRREMLAAVQSAAGERDAVLTTTGFTGRELFASGDRPNQLYLVGAMGCASSVGLGLALQRPDLRVIVLDGDGSALMRLGALAAIGYQRPANLVHIVLDNGMHESTGGQATVARSINLAAIAADCGYPDSRVVTDPDELRRLLDVATRNLTFVHAPIAPGVTPDLPRPDLSPSQTAERFREHFRAIAGNDS